MGETGKEGPVAVSASVDLGDIRTAITHLKCALAVLERADESVAAAYVGMALDVCDDIVGYADERSAG